MSRVNEPVYRHFIIDKRERCCCSDMTVKMMLKGAVYVFSEQEITPNACVIHKKSGKYFSGSLGNSNNNSILCCLKRH